MALRVTVGLKWRCIVALSANQSYLVLQGFLTRDKGIEVDSLDSLVKNKSVPEGQQDAFKSGFAEGFLKAQTLTRRTQGKFYNKLE